ncbi:rod shape-determining protein MreC [Comamonas faecalis]|uniref:Cell shape-determining protein MreC n=1 Tax=Comamonas faecalis TaxID=1387849 RepID=A0ABP7RKW0_9BURK
MPLGTLERRAPSMFRQGPSPLAQLALYGALALFLMVADARFHLTGPIRQAVATVLYPLQWVMLQPVVFADHGADYFQSLESAQQGLDTARRQMALMAVRAGETDELLRENAQLRELLALRERLPTPAQAAQVLYDNVDPYTRRIIIDKGLVAGIEAGSPVLDASGVLGQVTRVYPMLSEVTLLTDHDQIIPVLNLRTGVRSIAYGDPGSAQGMELRYTPVNADVQEGDLLTTSGVDGVYPPGLPVARITQVQRRADTAFARIACAPLAQMLGTRHVMVLTPVGQDTPERPAPGPQPKRARP